jgi:deoxyribodipyrimidine photo-lyase
MGTNIWWVRRDLRLNDNQALQKAISAGKPVIPLFIFDPKLLNSSNAGERRIAFLKGCLSELDKDLRLRGSRLIVRRGDPAEILKNLVKECNVDKIFAEADYSPYARRRDGTVAEQLPLALVGGLTISHPESIVKDDGTPYRVFTPFMRRWKEKYLSTDLRSTSVPDLISTPGEIQSEKLDIQADFQSKEFEPGEKTAMAKLKRFTQSPDPGIEQYADLRNRMDKNGTAILSPYLRFGLLSIRQCVSAALQIMQTAPDESARHSAEIWLNELIWREFYFSILFHFPFVMKHSFKEELRGISWRNDEHEFSAWCKGQTGYPVVDASIRQLLETGWMHNRGRMIAASFLVKDLVIDWRWGEKFFMQQLLDGDPAANNGGWQWTAGTGTDAAPYFRIFNPILQGKKFDPRGDFVRSWVPELSKVPDKCIHAPWEMETDLQKSIGCIIGRDYPLPIVDHGFARERILEVYLQAKQRYQ